ncbi:hypothetical protein B0J14DRAFT_555594 [Halenospora varia]|nr:hypothetical protein B0J14DRAFT_555594 [Halenospora varia]
MLGEIQPTTWAGVQQWISKCDQLQAQVDDVEDELQEKSDEIFSLEGEHDRLRALEAALRKNIEYLRKEVRALQEDIQETKARMEKSASQDEKNRKQTKDALSGLRKTQPSFTSAEGKLEKAEGDLKRLQVKHDEFSGKHVDCTSKIANSNRSYSKELDKAQSEVSDSYTSLLKKQQEESKAIEEKYKNTLASIEKDLKRMTDLYNKLLQERKSKENEFNTMKNSKKKAIHLLKEERIKNKDMENDVEQLGLVTTELSTANNRISTLEAENAALKKELDDAKSKASIDKSATARAVAAVRSEKDAQIVSLRLQITDYESVIDAHNDTIENLEQHEILLWRSKKAPWKPEE